VKIDLIEGPCISERRPWLGVDLLIFASCKANNPIARLKAGDIAADLNDLTDDV